MRIGLAILACLPIGWSASAASAASILNDDVVSHEFTVLKDGRTHVIRAWGGHEKTDVCPMGCEISFGDTNWTLMGNEQIVIQDGKVGIRRH